MSDPAAGGARIERTVRQRQCARCSGWFETPHGGPWPARFCSPACHAADKRAHTLKRTSTPRRPISPATAAQRAAVAGRACVVCRSHPGGCHPAHLIDRALADDRADPRAVVPLCPECHRGYDEGAIDLLAYLEPHHRELLAFAVERHGLLGTLERVTNQRWAPQTRVDTHRSGI